ncbi:putative protein-like [Tropilaelaps mercedesae]|uniref:Uncharacterized protein n=1 Tax=Tropilaelaps mercedesae TaxID=418985 RepID=A0A1V9X8Y1_9ACAR|nr:putative protein-like [Tropilaelaps mercedesae]
MLPANYVDNQCKPVPGKPNSSEFGLKLQMLPGNTTSPKLTNLFFSYGGPREQMNSVTAYIDLSLLYGSSIGEANRLRDQRLLHMMYMSDKNRLPLLEEHGCVSEHCFVTGDFRANATPTLTALHTI